MERIVDLSSEGLHIAVSHGFLTISEGLYEKGRIPLDDIGALITHAHGLTWSNCAFVKLAERNVPVVLCASNHSPIACLWPLEGHYLQGARLRLQTGASKPLVKQIWQQLVVAKIQMQRAVLELIGKDAEAFALLARRVRSGDPANVEAQAARRYWPLLMGEEFRRDVATPGANAMLNYGYTVLRAIVARAICAAGLHPTFGVQHSNRSNCLALADDLMEPFRPLVDRLVFNLIVDGEFELNSPAKVKLAKICVLDLETPAGTSTLARCASYLVHSLVQSFESGKPGLTFPYLPGREVLFGLGRVGEA